MSAPFIAQDGYWDVTDTLSGSDVFSGRRGLFVPLADADYVTWLAREGGGNVAPTVPTFAGLLADLNALAIEEYSSGFGMSVNVISSAVDVTLTNPVSQFQVVTMTAGSKKLILALANTPVSIPLGWPVYIINAGPTNSFVVNDGSSDIATVGVSEMLQVVRDSVAYNAMIRWTKSAFIDTTNAANITSGVLAVANGGTGDTGSAWTAYTPTVASTIGAFTTTSASGRYKTIGKTTFFEATVTITAVGTAGGGMRIGTPNTPNNNVSVNASDSVLLLLGLIVPATGNFVTVWTPTGTSAIAGIVADGTVVTVNGVYEST